MKRAGQQAAAAADVNGITQINDLLLRGGRSIAFDRPNFPRRLQRQMQICSPRGFAEPGRKLEMNIVRKIARERRLFFRHRNADKKSRARRSWTRARPKR